MSCYPKTKSLTLYKMAVTGSVRNVFVTVCYYTPKQYPIEYLRGILCRTIVDSDSEPKPSAEKETHGIILLFARAFFFDRVPSLPNGIKVCPANPFVSNHLRSTRWL